MISMRFKYIDIRIEGFETMCKAYPFWENFLL